MSQTPPRSTSTPQTHFRTVTPFDCTEGESCSRGGGSGEAGSGGTKGGGNPETAKCTVFPKPSVQIAMKWQSRNDLPRTQNLRKLLTTSRLLFIPCPWHPLCSEVFG